MQPGEKMPASVKYCHPTLRTVGTLAPIAMVGDDNISTDILYIEWDQAIGKIRFSKCIAFKNHVL